MTTAVLLGAGNRGGVYARYALEHPDRLELVALAEPDRERRERLAAAHGVPPEHRFDSWQSLLAAGRLADALLNCTMDRQHHASTLAALDAGYHVLLEKPIAPTLAETVDLVGHADARGRLLMICHVLRYTRFFRTVREIVRSGRLGRIVHVDHRENVWSLHMAHSFVRGNWREAASSGPMILTKCCHDLDILGWILGREVVRLASFGALAHFRPEHAPPGASDRCSTCPVDDCLYDARDFYLGPDVAEAFVRHLVVVDTPEARRAALEAGPYGRCVYRADNDVVDHQTVAMLLDDGTTVNLVMHGHSDEECRTLRVDGADATLYGKFAAGGHRLRLVDHRSGNGEDIALDDDPGSGHGGGDDGLMAAFLDALDGADDDSATARVSLESHLLAFAAEEARLSGETVDMARFRADALSGSHPAGRHQRG